MGAGRETLLPSTAAKLTAVPLYSYRLEFFPKGLNRLYAPCDLIVLEELHQVTTSSRLVRVADR